MTNLADLPPSAKVVINTLEDGQPMTHSEIVNESNLPKATASDALGRLQEVGVVERRVGEDARCRVYRLNR